jgi:hypothetical protein
MYVLVFVRFVPLALKPAMFVGARLIEPFSPASL